MDIECGRRVCCWRLAVGQTVRGISIKKSNNLAHRTSSHKEEENRSKTLSTAHKQHFILAAARFAGRLDPDFSAVIKSLFGHISDA